MNKKGASLVRSFWVRFFIILLILGALYLLLVAWPQQRSRNAAVPVEQIAAVSSTLAENRLILGNFQQINSGGSAVSENLEALLAQLQENHSKLQELGEQHSLLIGPDVHKDIQGLVTKQQEIMEQYQARFQAFSKIVAYNPADDLNLDVESQKTELAARATDSSQALSELANKNQFTATIGILEHKFSLPKEARNALSDSSACFQAYAEHLSANKLGAAVAKKNDCVSIYLRAKQHVVSSVVSVFSGPLARETITQAEQSIASLDKKMAEFNGAVSN